MTPIAYGNGLIQNTCGVGVLSVFRRSYDIPPSTRNLTKLKPMGGAGWLIASFTDEAEYTAAYKLAYEVLKKRFKIVHQSPVRKNKRTGRQFFFCIYDTTRKGN